MDGNLEVRRTATIKPGQIERSGFFSTGPQRTNWRLQFSSVSVQPYVWLQRNGHFPTEDDDYVMRVQSTQKIVNGGVHSSRIKCMGVQLTQKTGKSSQIPLKMLRSIHPENTSIGCSLTFFSLFLYSDGSSPTFFRKWASSCQFFELTEHLYI